MKALRTLQRIVTAMVFALLPVAIYLGITQNHSPLEVRVSIILYMLTALFHGLTFPLTKNLFWKLWCVGFGGFALITVLTELPRL